TRGSFASSTSSVCRQRGQWEMCSSNPAYSPPGSRPRRKRSSSAPAGQCLRFGTGRLPKTGERSTGRVARPAAKRRAWPSGTARPRPSLLCGACHPTSQPLRMIIPETCEREQARGPAPRGTGLLLTGGRRRVRLRLLLVNRLRRGGHRGGLGVLLGVLLLLG